MECFAADQEMTLLVRNFASNIIGKVVMCTKEKDPIKAPTKKVLLVIENINSLSGLNMKKNLTKNPLKRELPSIAQFGAPLKKKVKPSSANKENRPLNY